MLCQHVHSGTQNSQTIENRHTQSGDKIAIRRTADLRFAKFVAKTGRQITSLFVKRDDTCGSLKRRAIDPA